MKTGDQGTREQELETIDDGLRHARIVPWWEGVMSREAMMRTAQMLVEHCVALRRGEHVLVIGDTETASIAEVLAEAARASGGEVVTAIMTPRAQHGNDPPRTLAAAMQAADVMLMAVTHSITHTTARQEASARGARAAILRSVTVESMTQGAATADYPALRALTRDLADILTMGKTVHLTSEKGTDLELSIDGRRALSLDGFATAAGTFTPFPTGEAPIVPREGSAQGVVVFDHAIDNVGVLDAPIRCQVEGGRIVRVHGGRSAEIFRSLIATDEHASNIAEFAIGTNPASRLRGNMAEDKVLLGVVHIGIGDSHTIGGQIESKIHVDAIILNPTVEVDGRRIVERRRVLVQVR